MRRQNCAVARAAGHAAANSRDRREPANMRAALLVARELLRCRLLDTGHDALLLRVAELLDAAATGAEPFCFRITSPETGGRPDRARSPVWARPTTTYEGDVGYDPLNPAYDSVQLPQAHPHQGTAHDEDPSKSGLWAAPGARHHQTSTVGGSGMRGQEPGPAPLAISSPPSPPMAMEQE